MRQGGGSRLRQLVSVLWLANRQNIAPSSYFKFKLYLPERARSSLRFVQHHEIGRLLRILYRGIDVARLARLANKGEFHEVCRRHHIATPQVFLWSEEGEALRDLGESGLPPRDLVLKPTLGHGGAGVEAWRYRADQSVWEHDGQGLDQRGLCDRALALGRTGGCIVQEGVEVAPELRALSHKGVCTLRILTYQFPGESPLVLLRVVRIPTGDSYADNIHVGGIAAAVRSDGRLGPACGRYYTGATQVDHPDTGELIEGFELPPQLLSDAEQLCLRAHVVFRDFAFVGWDVILSGRGVLLLEGNSLPCVDLAQVPSGVPLGDSDFAACYMRWFRHRADQPEGGVESSWDSLRESEQQTPHSVPHENQAPRVGNALQFVEAANPDRRA